MKNQDWHSISRFESHDLVKHWYKTTHGKEPSTAKISQINAFFIQGREYFRNAAVAEMSVKPLLLYYGVLSLSRGAILLRDTSKKGGITQAKTWLGGCQLAKHSEGWN